MVSYRGRKPLPGRCPLRDDALYRTMKANLASILLLIAIILVWVIAKVRYYMRVSDEQWRRVDKSKLVEWRDDEE